MISIMVVEDEYLLAMDLADLLQKEGYQVLGPAPSVERALALISQGVPSVGILDIQLRDERSYIVAEKLLHLGVPIIFLTSYGREEVPQQFKDVPLISKLDGSAAIKNELRAVSKNIPATP